VTSAPTATTGLPISVGTTTASLDGTVNPNGVATNFVFEFGTSLAFGNITTPGSAGSGTDPVGLTANLSGLSPSTTYYYRVVATNSLNQTSTGVVRSFRTTGAASPPVALTGDASAITTSGATLNGQVNPRGSQTSYTFEYGTSTAFGQITPVVALDDADALEPVSATLTGLAPNTTYFYRTVATNGAGTTAGPVSAFTTGPGGPPIVTTGAATGVTATSATLNGIVNPNGAQTAYTFEYGTTNAFGSISAVESAGQVSGANPFALPITGLAPNTTYLYRIVATNANGTATGAIMSFETAPAA
jgi:phosphodiesterase/alkaline phosphatase D-like protein